MIAILVYLSEHVDCFESILSASNDSHTRGLMFDAL